MAVTVSTTPIPITDDRPHVVVIIFTDQDIYISDDQKAASEGTWKTILKADKTAKIYNVDTSLYAMRVSADATVRVWYDKELVVMG